MKLKVRERLLNLACGDLVVDVVVVAAAVVVDVWDLGATLDTDPSPSIKACALAGGPPGRARAVVANSTTKIHI